MVLDSRGLLRQRQKLTFADDILDAQIVDGCECGHDYPFAYHHVLKVHSERWIAAILQQLSCAKTQ
jgi:hypothetical protein